MKNIIIIGILCISMGYCKQDSLLVAIGIPISQAYSSETECNWLNIENNSKLKDLVKFEIYKINDKYYCNQLTVDKRAIIYTKTEVWNHFIDTISGQSIRIIKEGNNYKFVEHLYVGFTTYTYWGYVNSLKTK